MQAAATQPLGPIETAPSPPRPGLVAARTPRSRVGKGKVLLSGVDTHSRTYLEYRDVVDDLADHLGSAPTVVQRAIIEEAAGLVVWCRKARLALLKGDEFNISAYTTATNTLRRLLADIGQEALLKDVTPDLDTYLASKRETKRLAAEAAQQFEDDGDGVVVETAQPSDANGHDEAAA